MLSRRQIPQLVVRPHDPRRSRLVAAGIALIWVVSLIAAWFLGGDHAAPGYADVRSRLSAVETGYDAGRIDLDKAMDRLAVLERSEQVARTANESLQSTLREREEEITGLRADLAFYQRLVGGKASRHSLNVHALALKPIGDSGGYAFRLTLTQNLKKAAVSTGTVALSVEGAKDKQLLTLAWADVAQGAGKAPLAFSFKYFQRLDGSVMLPDGFTPERIRLVATSEGGEQVEKTVGWDEAMANGEDDDVWQ